MIYVLEFDEPIGNPERPRGQAKYYLGYCRDDRLEDRFLEHITGRGAKIVRGAIEQGRVVRVVLVMRGGYALEQRLKAQKNSFSRLLKKHPRLHKRTLVQYSHLRSDLYEQQISVETGEESRRMSLSVQTDRADSREVVYAAI